MPETARHRAKKEPFTLYRRIEAKLGIGPLQSDGDLARLVEEGLPLSSVDSLSTNGISNEEIYRLIVPRRTLTLRKARHKLLTRDESDRAVWIARAISQAEQVFGNDAKAARWLRKPKQRFEGCTPLDLLRSGIGSRIVEEMLLQIDYGITA